MTGGRRTWRWRGRRLDDDRAHTLWSQPSSGATGARAPAEPAAVPAQRCRAVGSPVEPSTTAPVLEVNDARRGPLQVHRGEHVSLLGASGAGKSMWIRSLLGLHEPFDEVRLWGMVASKELVACVIGWVPEGDGVLLSSSVLDNVTVRTGERAITRAQGIDALDLVGLAGRSREPVVHLNRAERRRVALARCLARRAPFLVIDTELDPILWPLFPMLCSYLPWIEAVLVSQSAVTSFSRQASTVAVVHGGSVIAQAPLAELDGTPDPAVRQVIGSLQREGTE